MAIEKVITHNVNVEEDGQLQVREITRVMEDGKQIAKTYHHYNIEAGDDITGQPQIIKDAAKGVHTQERIATRQAKLAEIARAEAELEAKRAEAENKANSEEPQS